MAKPLSTGLQPPQAASGCCGDSSGLGPSRRLGALICALKSGKAGCGRVAFEPAKAAAARHLTPDE
eukprot:CAMPEP_0181192510 /NCGR_PEP_ID=MMETSP1096-20121128/13322_1 /TAXON_ID=156174 ORGANISM="Chrysochromulina ericina, Strain CCMP281" /NCGR_SAMPLE_ID=MMETSP1096 /ASSEMBLY_ACC=CAM_ASM_000453 /LENGTH=65 /DNA_ID=CAMNT_0023281911 /DNA_START=214 /DNA_END=411 /DNA_ORIENTATION=+